MKALMIDSVVGNDYSSCLCNYLSETGVDICLVVPENRKGRRDANFSIMYWGPSKDQRYGKLRKLLEYFRYVMRLFIYIIKTKTKVVHYQFLRRSSEALLFLLLRLLGRKIVYTAHNVFPHERSKMDFLLNLIVCKASQKIIVHSQYIKDKLIKNFKIKSSKIQIIPHGNFDNYLPEKSITKQEARRNLNLSPKDKVLLFFGFIREYKGLDLLLDAFQIAAGSSKQLKLVIAGAPQNKALENRYLAKIRSISNNGRILFYPEFIPSEEIPHYFMAADMVVLPYKNIDHSGIIHLAYSFGKPVIATRVGDFEETLVDGKAGFLLQRNEVDSLASLILSAFSDRKKLNKMGKFAKKLNDVKYSWNNIAKQTLSLYETLLI